MCWKVLMKTGGNKQIIDEDYVNVHCSIYLDLW